MIPCAGCCGFRGIVRMLNDETEVGAVLKRKIERASCIVEKTSDGTILSIM